MPVEDLERRAQLGDFLEVAGSEVGSFQLLLAELRQWVQTATEARICSAVTGPPAASPSIPSKPEPIHTPGVSPRSV